MKASPAGSQVGHRARCQPGRSVLAQVRTVALLSATSRPRWGARHRLAVQPVAAAPVAAPAPAATNRLRRSRRARWFARSRPHLADAQDHCASLGREQVHQSALLPDRGHRHEAQAVSRSAAKLNEKAEAQATLSKVSFNDLVTKACALALASAPMGECLLDGG